MFSGSAAGVSVCTITGVSVEAGSVFPSTGITGTSSVKVGSVTGVGAGSTTVLFSGSAAGVSVCTITGVSVGWGSPSANAGVGTRLTSIITDSNVLYSFVRVFVPIKQPPSKFLLLCDMHTKNIFAG